MLPGNKVVVDTAQWVREISRLLQSPVWTGPPQSAPHHTAVV